MRFDQHFVTDEDVLSRIMELADIQEDEVVLEIGPGTGNLTKFLVEGAKKVYAIELDKSLEEDLAGLEKQHKNLEITWGNALDLEWPEFDKMVSNIPYSLSEPLVQKLAFCDFKKAVLLVPRNFSEIVLGRKNTKLAVIAQTFFDIAPDIEVYPDSFSPPPAVGSKVLVISPKKPKTSQEVIFWEFLRQKDKIAKNALREAIIRGYEKEGRKMTKKEAKKAMEVLKCGKNLGLRVSCLGMDELLEIRQFLDNLGI